MQTLLTSLPNAGESPVLPSVKVRCTFQPTTIEVVLNNISDCQLSAANFKHVLTAAEPGNNVDSLSWAALKQYQFWYGHKVQPTASLVWPPMEFCYPDLEKPIATLCFDKLECGSPCAVEDTATGKLYTRMRVVNNDDTLGPVTDLKFTCGQILLIA